MNKKELYKLGVGEKLVQIEEFGQTIQYYKVTIYKCVSKFLWIHHIEKNIIPFFFNTKELATEFLKYYDNFNWEKDDAYVIGWIEAFVLKLEGFTNNHTYHMINNNGEHLKYLDIWSGYVNTNARYGIKPEKTIYFTDMFKMESELVNYNSNNPNKEYIFKMIK